jgi:hypothetical protein
MAVDWLEKAAHQINGFREAVVSLSEMTVTAYARTSVLSRLVPSDMI